MPPPSLVVLVVLVLLVVDVVLVVVFSVDLLLEVFELVDVDVVVSGSSGSVENGSVVGNGRDVELPPLTVTGIRVTVWILVT